MGGGKGGVEGWGVRGWRRERGSGMGEKGVGVVFRRAMGRLCMLEGT